MADINKLIKELWQRTYRNRDIDYVEIKADADMGKGAKSYNYRLVMHVGGAELEMRGRCSAGQKVGHLAIGGKKLLASRVWVRKVFTVIFCPLGKSSVASVEGRPAG